ncbi:MAG: ribulose-phosphate 3-epimerase [Chloroflexi bacterium]|nr:ribulose-phosphate 3-epimerase [Chloroflexota bacterium]
MTELLLSSSILSADFAHLADQIKMAEDAGVDWLHIDVMDGHFVPNITMGPFIVETCRRISSLPLDVHLMIEKPENHVEAFAHAGANWISIHVENNPNVHRTLQYIRSLGCHPGVVLNPGTPAYSLAALVNDVDLILAMTVNPGFSGQEFIHNMVPKIAELRRMLDANHSPAQLEVDGGINEQTLPAVLKAGATVCVAATAIFKHPSGIAAGVKALREAAC